MTLGDAAGAVLGGAVRSIVLESAVTPRLEFAPGVPGGGSSGGGDGSGGPLRFDPLRLLRPRVTVQLAGGAAPLEFAPGGPPPAWGWVVALALVAIAGWGAVEAARGLVR